MKIQIKHLDSMRFEAKTQKGESFVIDCPKISPIEYFLAGLITCSASDLVMLPNNQNKSISNISVEGEVVRQDDHPRKFTTLHLSYSFDSDADDLSAKRWVQASIETYCSTIGTVRDSTKITYSITHNSVAIVENIAIISGEGSGIDLGKIDACCS